MTRGDVVEATGTLFSWILAHGSGLAIMGAALWWIVQPAILTKADEVILEAVKKQVPIIVAEQVEDRFKAIEENQKQISADLEHAKDTQAVIMGRQEKVLEQLPQLEGKLDTILQLLTPTPVERAR